MKKYSESEYEGFLMAKWKEGEHLEKMRWEEEGKMEKEEREREEKRAAERWWKSPMRGEPVDGTGKHRWDRGQGTPFSSVRRRRVVFSQGVPEVMGRRAERLIGGRRSVSSREYDYVLEKRREEMWRRADSNEADGTIFEFEAEIEQRLAHEDAVQRMYDEQDKEAHEKPFKPAYCWIGGWGDERLEGDEGEEMGLEGGDEFEGEDCDGEESNGNGCSTFEVQVQFMLNNDFKVSGGEAQRCVGRRQSVRKLGWPKRCNGYLEANSVFLPSPEEQIFLRGEEPFETI